MPRKQKDVERGLEAKGFRRGEGDHHYFHYYSRAGKKTHVFTKTSHSVREIDDGLLGQMARQCKLARGDFERLVDCPLSQEAYEGKLVEKGFVEQATA